MPLSETFCGTYMDGMDLGTEGLGLVSLKKSIFSSRNKFVGVPYNCGRHRKLKTTMRDNHASFFLQIHNLTMIILIFFFIGK